MLDNQCVAVTGGTGSLGQLLVRRLLGNELGQIGKLVVFSRDEAKQHAMRTQYLNRAATTDEVIYDNFRQRLEFRIGDVRDARSVASLLRDVDVVLNTAAIKQVPTCEYFPSEAVMTNIGGAENITQTIRDLRLPVKTVVGISTDKACKPVNVMGMTKAIQERVFIRANLDSPQTRTICVRYGNVLASRGSVIPYFHEQIRSGGPITITTTDMTRFLLSLNEAVDVIFSALRHAKPGETFIPRVPSARITDLAAVLIGDRPIDTRVTGIRPGEKVHEILVSEEEAHRTIARDGYYVIRPILPELCDEGDDQKPIDSEYSSADHLMTRDQLTVLLRERKLMVDDVGAGEGELLR